jgi:hypothetical protein
MERTPSAKLNVAPSRISVCRTSGILYSTGSSRVMTFRPGVLIAPRIA